MGKVTSVWFEPARPAPFPSWWKSWIDDSHARLPNYRVGPISGFALTGVHLLAGEGAEATRFVRSLAGVQTGEKVQLKLVPGINFADMSRRQIYLDSDIILNKGPRTVTSFEERLDILSGCSIHESLHLMHSSKRLVAWAKRRGRLYSAIHNIIEDEFIESRLPESSPGYVPFLRATRTHYFGEPYESVVGQDNSLLNAFLLFVRNPCRLTSSQVAEFAEPLNRIRKILTPFPENADKVFRAARRVHSVFRKYCHDAVPSPQLWEFLDRLYASDVGESGASEERAIRKEEVSEVRIYGQVIWQKPESNSQQYEEDRTAVCRHIGALRQWLATWELARCDVFSTGRTAGMIDRRKLHLIPSGEDRIFKQRQALTRRSITLALLVDESGSMKGAKIREARRLAILFQEAFRRSEYVELFIFGHSADIHRNGDTTIFEYRMPGSAAPYLVGGMQARSNNRDGVAIEAVARRVRESSRNREIVVLVISDGQPHGDGYKGDAAVEHVRTAVAKLERDGIRVFQVAIDASVNSSKMFSHYLTLNTVSGLNPSVIQLLKRMLGNASFEAGM